MKHFIALMIILSMSMGSVVSSGDGSNADRLEADLVKDILGLELIKDKQFRKWLLEFFSRREELNYEANYEYLSAGFLKRYFSHILDAQGYKIHMENISEVSALKYLEVTKWVKVNNLEYEIELIFRANSEGVVGKYQTTYRFIKEEGKWKYDGLDSDSYRTIEE